MRETVVQIYEIQTPEEAQAMIDRGVDHIGSVITSVEQWQNPVIKNTVNVTRQMGAVSSLIPLYTDSTVIFDTLEYYQPHIVHFCDSLNGEDRNDARPLDDALKLQQAVKHRFPEIRIMRSIAIEQHMDGDGSVVLAMAKQLEPLSDYFLTDTVIVGQLDAADVEQPVSGFVGITGMTCDWSVATKLVSQSRIPVILAGGISPENVAEGIRQVNPFGVDSCTCTNAVDHCGMPIRFCKDMERVEALVSAVRIADDMLRANTDDGLP